MQPFVAALGTELGLTSKDIADIIWLALQMQNLDGVAESTTSLKTASPEPKREVRSRSISPDLTPPIKEEKPESKSQQKSAGLHQPQSNQSSFGQQLALNVPDARSLREPLSLARSLKPLLRRVVTGWSTSLDEAATVERIADEQLWLPVFKPALEPWLDLALVVDESLSMQIWQRTIAELQRLLSHYGVFRDVRVWGLVTNEPGEVKLYPGIGATARRHAARRPSELIDPSGRRLILVATDCVSSGWQDGSLLPALKLWATSGPLAIVQMLPEWLWSRTGLGFASAVKLQSLVPGVPNQQLIASDVSPWDEIDLDAGIKVPVVTLEPEPFATWTEIVAGKGGVWSPGFVLEEVVDPNGQIVQRPDIAVEGSAEQRVQRFRVTASPMARRLAGLLAAAPVISLPVVRIIQDRLLPESRQVHVAEVFLGGLLKPLGAIGAEANPDTVQYDFLDGVREVLLESVPTSDSVNVLEEVSRFVAERLGLSLDAFAAVLRDPQQAKDQELAIQSRPFAMVTAQILRQLGGEYAQFAEDLDRLKRMPSLLKSEARENPIDIRKLFQATNPSKTLDTNNLEDRKYYIDFSSVRGRSLIDELKYNITDFSGDSPTCNLFTGHIGCGKTTELLRLKQELEDEGYHVVYSDSSEDLEMADVDIGDLLLAIAKQVSKSLGREYTVQKAQGFWAFLGAIKQALLTNIELKGSLDFGITKVGSDTEKQGMTLSIGIAELTLKTKNDQTSRERLNQYLSSQKQKLLDVINQELLEPAISLLRKQGKRGLVVIVDTLNRIDNREKFGKPQGEYLFIDQSEWLTKLNCHVVYTIPWDLKFSSEYGMLIQRYPRDPIVVPMVPVQMRDGTESQGLYLLKQMVLARAFPDLDETARQENISAIFDSPESLDRLCKVSGGNIRNLLRLLHGWIIRDRTLPLTAKTLEDIIRAHRNEMILPVSNDEWELLKQVRQRKYIGSEKEYQRLIRSQLVYEYRNQSGVWFDINPVLLESNQFRS